MTEKRVLRRVGNFQELGYDDDPNAPRLVDVRGKRAPDNKAEVVRYLRSGKTLIVSPGIDQDVFDDRKRADTSSIVTDGTFMWQRQIAYYVEHYDIELPAEFEAHMRANGWQVPEHVDISTLQAPR
jgi:hypothetical protein